MHHSYAISWPSLVGPAGNVAGCTNYPAAPLSYSLFIRHWAADFPTLRIAKSVSDFCDYCTSTKSHLKILDRTDAIYDTLAGLLVEHRNAAHIEYLHYKKCQAEAQQQPMGSTRHLVFDFAEKVLLPKLLRQPGQLHFITGLKFDMFGISSSNENRNYIFGLPEGHWPNEKTANAVVSMLHHVLSCQRQYGRGGAVSRKLVLHADNCAGQNKNLFVLWYLSWRVMMGLDDEVTLFFLVAGHTKNVCDGAFGQVKRRLAHQDAITPAEMMHVIDNSSTTTSIIPSAAVLWFQWKDHLNGFFKNPQVFDYLSIMFSNFGRRL